MKYIHFEDWTQKNLLQHIEENGLPHAGRIIKIFASDKRPDERFKKPGLALLESSDEPFTPDEIFDYGDNGVFTGEDLEAKLSSLALDAKAKELFRALFRFENRPDLGFCQASMAFQNEDGSFRFTDPFAGIDGIYHVQTDLSRAENSTHLDIFFPESMRKLETAFDLKDPARFLGFREAYRTKVAERQMARPSVEGK